MDFFGADKDTLREVASTLRAARSLNNFVTKTHESRNAFTVHSPGRMPVQFIHRWLFDDPHKVAASFDFTIAQAAIWWEDHWSEEGSSDPYWSSYCHGEFYADLAARRLVYTMPTREEEAGGSIMRMLKFMRKGYDIQVPSLAKLITRTISTVRMSGMFETEEGRAKVIEGILREVDPATIIDGVEFRGDDEHEEKEEG